MDPPDEFQQLLVPDFPNRFWPSFPLVIAPALTRRAANRPPRRPFRRRRARGPAGTLFRENVLPREIAAARRRISLSCSSSLFFRRSSASSFFSALVSPEAAILIGIRLSHPVPKARLADPEILRDPVDRCGALAGELDSALPELRRVWCGHDGHPSRWPLATSGRVPGRREEAQPRCALV